MTLLINTIGATFKGLSSTTAGLLLLASVAVGCLGIGAAGAVFVMDSLSLPERVAQLEVWRDTHLEEVTSPNVARIDLLEANLDRFRSTFDTRWDNDVAMIREMTFQLYCREFPARCQSVPTE